MKIIELLKDKIQGKNIKIVFPEGIEPRIIGAVIRLKKENLLEPILIGDKKKIEQIAKENGFTIDGIRIINPLEYEDFDNMVDSYVERRKGKDTVEKAKELLKNVNYFGTMLVHMKMADGLVSGSIHPTGDTVLPALKIIKTKPGVTRTSGVFLMLSPSDDKYLFADCAININLDSSQLAEVAIESAKTAEMFNIEPKVAMLSFSTNGSADAPEASKVAEATKIAKELMPTLAIDGEMQFDAAIVPKVGKLKFPDSKVAGHANVFIFPSLEAANIGYKIAQRLGNFKAIGPILQGLNKPVNDLSRGCNEDDVYNLAIITAAQHLI